MLQRINEKIQGWVAWAVVLLIAFTFALFGVASYLSDQVQAEAVASVDGTEITSNQLHDAYQRTVQQQMASMGDSFILTPDTEKLLKKQALDALVQNLVLEQGALKEGYIVSKQQVEQQLMKIPAFQEDGQFSQLRFQQVLQNAQYTPEAFLNQLQEGILLNQARAAFVGSSFSLPNDIERMVELMRQQRDFRYLVIPASHFKEIAKPTETAIKQYYQDHQSEFHTQAKVKLKFIELSRDTVASKISISDQQIQQYFKDNQGAYLRPARWKLAHILIKVPADASDKQLEQAEQKVATIEKAIAQGQSFKALAKQYSDDVISAQQGGEFPWLLANSVPEAYRETVVSITKAGEVATPIRTDNGFEIIKVIGYQAPKPTPLSKVKDQIKQALINDKVQQEFSELSEQLATLTYQNADNLQSAADQLELTVQSSDWVTSDANQSGIAANSNVIQAAFSEEVLTQGNNSDVLPVGDDKVVVIRVTEHQPSKVKPLAQVKSNITGILLKQAQGEQAKKVGEMLVKRLANKQAINEQLQQYKLQWKKAKGLKSTDDSVPADVIRLAFQLSLPVKGQPLPMTSESTGDDNFVIVQLQTVVRGDIKDITNEQRDLIRTQIQNTLGLLDYQYYVNGLKQQVKISYPE